MSDQGKSSPHKSDVVVFKDYCDAVINVEDVEFQIHKITLCKCSPYFQDLFRRCSASVKNVFDIPGVSPDIMQLIIEFAYTGIVSVTEGNAQQLLLAADQLSIMGIVETCCVFLEEHLRPNNCISIWQFTNIFFIEALQPKAYSFITEHFEEVASCEEFLQLSVQELITILDRDDLNVSKESTVFEAIVHWISHKCEERKGHIAVRLALTSIEYIRSNVMSHELVENNAECLSMLRATIQTICRIVMNRPSVPALSNSLARPRLPNAVLFATGGWSGNNPTNSIEAYDVRANCWINVTNSLERDRAYHGTAFLNGCVYCVGGFDRVEQLNSMHRLDLSTQTWHEAAPMYYHRSYVSVTVLDGCIYAIGGFDGYTRLRTAEHYRPETNQWSLIAPMHEQRSDASCTTLHNKLYICGGFTGSECLQTCECYIPETNQWTTIAPMDIRRTGIGIIAFADRVYAVGGYDGNDRLRSVEAYNPWTNTWHAVSSMLNPRSNFGIEVINDQLFAVGGFNGLSTSHKVEFYDAASNMWSEACDMDISRSALSCCVVSEIPNMINYTVPRATLPFLNLEDESPDSEGTV